MPCRQINVTNVMIDHLHHTYKTNNLEFEKQTLIKTIRFDRFPIKESNTTNLRAIKDSNGRKG